MTELGILVCKDHIRKNNLAEPKFKFFLFLKLKI